MISSSSLGCLSVAISCFGMRILVVLVCGTNHNDRESEEGGSSSLSWGSYFWVCGRTLNQSLLGSCGDTSSSFVVQQRLKK